MNSGLELEDQRKDASPVEQDVALVSRADSRTGERSPGHWLNVVSHLDPRYGGLSAVVPQLGSSIAQTGQFSVGLAAFCAPGEAHAPETGSALATSYWPSSRLAWMRDPSLRARFRSEVERADGVHIHGLWEQSTAVASQTAHALRKPYVLSAHGMLEPWALHNRRLKKLVYAALFERARVNGAACLHALTGAEAADYRRFGGRGPVAVIPNGVHVPEFRSAEPFYAKFPALRHKRIVLFLGRLHPKKGLDILVDAWSTVARIWPEAHLVLAGPDFEGTRLGLEQKIQELGLVENITFTGMLQNQNKWSALDAAEGFILPSYSEGLSVSVLEAMGAGLPVMVTEQCNLPEVRDREAGWVMQSTSASVASTLGEFLSNSRPANQLIGDKGSKFVADRYTWSSVAGQMSELYRWVQGGPVPQNVDLRMS